MVLQHGVLDFSFSASEGSAERNRSSGKKKIDDDTRTGVMRRTRANGSDLHKNFGDILVLNAYRTEPV